MIRSLITEMYGGKIDDEGDFKMLSQLIHKFLTPEAYEINHKLVEGAGETNNDGGDAAGDLVVPQGTSMQEFWGWIQALPEREPPTYLGLPANAEKLLLVGLGQGLIDNVRTVTDRLEEGDQMMAEA